MRILVTGGAGFVGSRIVKACLDAGHDVAVIDDLSHGQRENVDPRARFFEADIRDGADVALVMDAFQPNAVSHQAAKVDVAWCEANPREAIDVNVRGTKVLASWAHRYGVQRLVFASSVGGYGERTTPATESDDFEPIGVYGETKKEAEYTLMRIGRLPVTILRYSNVYGPGAGGGVVRTFIEQWARQGRPTIYGDGEQLRDFIHVDDVAAANLLALEQGRAGEDWQVLNVASGNPITINRLWAMISASHEAARPMDIVESRVDPGAISKALGFSRAVDLDAGIARLASQMAQEMCGKCLTRG